MNWPKNIYVRSQLFFKAKRIFKSNKSNVNNLRNHSFIFETFSSKFELQIHPIGQWNEQIQQFVWLTEKKRRNSRIKTKHNNNGENFWNQNTPKSRTFRIISAVCVRFYDFIPVYYYQTKCRRLTLDNSTTAKKIKSRYYYNVLSCFTIQPFKLWLLHHRCQHSALVEFGALLRKE